MLQEAPDAKTAVIREASYHDLDELLRIGRTFIAQNGVADIIPLDERSLEISLIGMIDNPSATILVIDGGDGLWGTTGALLHPHYWNASHITGQELWWWVDPEHRGHGTQLFDALEEWVRKMGAHSFTMMGLEAQRPEVVAKLYERRGYRPAERSFVKAF